MKTRISNALMTAGVTAAIITLSFSLITPAIAACDPARAQLAQQMRQADIQAEMDRIHSIYQGHNQQPPWLANSDGLLTACSANNWPKINVSQPILQKILSGAQEKAVNQACDSARQAIMSKVSTMKGVLNSIPGYSQYGSTITNAAGAYNNGGGQGLGDWASQPGNLGPSLPTTTPGGGAGWGDIGNILPPGTISGIPGITGSVPPNPKLPPQTPGGIPGITQ